MLITFLQGMIMRLSKSSGPLSAKAIAGTHVVLMALADLVPNLTKGQKFLSRGQGIAQQSSGTRKRGRSTARQHRCKDRGG
jgi:hypothetical protein